MELLLNSIVFVFGLGFLIYRSAKFIIFIYNPLPGDEEIKWRRAPKLPNLPSIKSRRLNKKNLFDFLKNDSNDLENSIKESYPMNSCSMEQDEDESPESIPDIEINIEENLSRSQRMQYQTSSPRQ